MQQLQDILKNRLQAIVSRLDQNNAYGQLIKQYFGWACLAVIVIIAIASYLSKPSSKINSRVQGVSVVTASKSVASSSASAKPIVSLKVDVSGEVNLPGVKILQVGDRVEDAIKAANGLTPKADSVYVAMTVNLAAKLQDGDKIFIPAAGQSNATPAGISTSPSNSSSSSTTTSASTGGKVSINRASATQLNNLPGIGDTYAQRIMAGRPYSSVDDLCGRSGIFRSKSTCDDIRPLITL